MTTKKNIQDIYQLSPMQQGMLFHSIYTTEENPYFEQNCWRLIGGLDIEPFERAWQRVVERHSALRSAFLWEELEQPLQVVYRQVDLSLDKHDWRTFSKEEVKKRLEDLLK